MRLARYKLFSPAPLKLGRWFGINLEIYPSLLFLLLCYGPFTSYFYLPAMAPGYTDNLYLLAAALCSLLLICSLLLHELAHALVAKLLHLPVGKISLDFFGGAAYLGAEPERPLDELVVALSGPAVSILTGLILKLLGSSEQEILSTVATHISLLNLALGLFNLLPGYPLDGGRVLRALLWWYTGDRTAAYDRIVYYGRLIALTLTATGTVKAITGPSRAMGVALSATGLLLLQSSLSRGREKPAPPLTELLERYYPTISPEASLVSFLKSPSDAVPVVKEGRLYGILLRSDALKHNAQTVNAAEAMRPVSDDHFVDCCDSLDDALTRAFRNGTGIVAVLDGDGLYLGTISVRSFSGRSYGGRY